MARPDRKRAAEPPSKTGGAWLNGRLVVLCLVVLIVAGVAVYLVSRRAGTSPAPGTGSTAASEPAAATETAPAIVTTRHIYSETADPRADIAAALKQARAEHKRVILDFGGDWCGDCQVLDIYFHQPPNAAILAKDFVLVHVWIGHMDQHVDVAEKYGIPLAKGVPALAVLAPNGSVLYAQKTGEFEKMRQMDPGSVTEFLNTWKS